MRAKLKKIITVFIVKPSVLIFKPILELTFELNFSLTLNRNTGCEYQVQDCFDNLVQTPLPTLFL